MFCRYCGNELPDDAQFCNACGKPVDTGQQESPPEPPHEESPSAEVQAAFDTVRGSVRKSGSKKAAVIAVIVLVVAALGAFGLRAVNESSMKQQVPQGIYEESKERVINHYDKTMAYPYGNDLGYTYGCDFTTFEITKGDASNTFYVTGKLEVEDKSQDNRPTYAIDVSGTVTTNFFRDKWSATWDMTYQDPQYSSLSNGESNHTNEHSDSASPSVNSGEYVSDSDGFYYIGKTKADLYADIDELRDAYGDNSVKAAQTYGNQYLMIGGYVREIRTNWGVTTVELECYDDEYGMGFYGNFIFEENSSDPRLSELRDGCYAAIVGYLDNEYIGLSITLTDCVITEARITTEEPGFIE